MPEWLGHQTQEQTSEQREHRESVEKALETLQRNEFLGPEIQIHW